MLGNECNLKMHFQNLGYPLPLQIGGRKTTFLDDFATQWQLSNDLSLERNMVYISGQVRWQLQGVSYIVSKRHELWSTNGFKLEVGFHSPSVNSAFHFIARLRRQTPANGTKPNFVKRWRVGRANKLPYRSWGHPSLKNWEPKQLLHFFCFSMT